MRLVEVRDGRFGLLGRVAFAAPPGRSATGGVRALERLDGLDLEALATTMARKYAFLPFPRNGAAKGAIVLPAEAPAEERRERLRAFGRALRETIRARRYRPWTDIGTTDADLAEIYAGAGVPAPAFGETGRFTAYSVAGSALGACDALGIEPSGARAAIHGFGSVGREVASSLSRLGFRVVAVANRDGCVAAPAGVDVAAVEREGVRGPRDRIFREPCDVFLACADARAIDAAAAEALDARAVVPGANDPFAAGAEEALARRGILVLPDFVANTGGILGSFLAAFGLDRGRIERFEHEAWRAACARLVELARKEGTTPAACARVEVDATRDRSWLSRKAAGAFYRLVRAPRPFRRAAGEAALAWARRALGRRFAGR